MTSGSAAKPGEHLIGSFIGSPHGPTLVVIGGLHGNEQAGVMALANIARELRDRSEKIYGRLYFLAGNTRALRTGVRFIDSDLNRCWTPKNLSSSSIATFASSSEGLEVGELCQLLDLILVTARDEVYVIDLHSTSAEGVPFATVGDTLRNRDFAQKFPVSILLGIEEQLEGTLLEYLNNAGAVTLGYEGGQHHSPKTVANHEAFVWAALTNTGIYTSKAKFEHQQSILAKSNLPGKIFEVRYRHPVKAGDEFEMKPGFNNFDPIRRGDLVAHDRNGPIKISESGLMLMPLYQKLGEDGFFIGRRVAQFWLSLSGFLRRIGVQEWVSLLPGVKRDADAAEKLIINTRIARLFPLQVFHLLGFRRRRWIGDKLIVSRRRHDSISPFASQK